MVVGLNRAFGVRWIGFRSQLWSCFCATLGLLLDFSELVSSLGEKKKNEDSHTNHMLHLRNKCSQHSV